MLLPALLLLCFAPSILSNPFKPHFTQQNQMCDQHAYYSYFLAMCICNKGYEGDGYTCEDDNECETKPAACDVHSNCVNTPGGFECPCRQGYQGDGKKVCLSDEVVDKVGGVILPSYTFTVTKMGVPTKFADTDDQIALRIEVQPSATYTVRPRNCFISNSKTAKKIQVTDKDGCATDPSFFPQWSYPSSPSIAIAEMGAFKFANTTSVHYECDLIVCVGKCDELDCSQRAVNVSQFRNRRALRGNEKGNAIASPQVVASLTFN